MAAAVVFGVGGIVLLFVLLFCRRVGSHLRLFFCFPVLEVKKAIASTMLHRFECTTLYSTFLNLLLYTPCAV